MNLLRGILEALLFAFAAGVAIWLAFLAAWFGTSRFVDVVLARGRPGEWTAPRVKRGKRKGHLE